MGEFEKNFKMISKHNATKAGFALGVNKFSDWTQAEYQKTLTFKPLKGRKVETLKKFNSTNTTSPVLDRVDWRTLDAVTSVKD